MPTLVLLFALAQSQEPVKLAVPGLTCVGVDAALGDVYLERFVTVLARTGGLKITTRRDIEHVLGLERQKELLGCSDGTNACLAELAGGLGVDGMITGSLAKAGSAYIVTIRIIRASGGAEVVSTTERLKDEDALGEWLDAEAQRLGARILAAFGRAPAVGATSARWPRLIPGIVGLGAIAGGGGLLSIAGGKNAQLSRGTIAYAQIDAAIADGRIAEVGGWVLIGVGAAAVAASAIWFAVGGSSQTTVGLAPVEQGGLLVVGGTFR